MKLLKLLLLLLLFIFPLGVLTRITPFSNVSFYAHDVVIFFVFFIYALFVVKDRGSIFASKIFLPILIFNIYLLVSLFINFKNLGSHEFYISLLYPLRIILYSSLIFVFGLFDHSFIAKYKVGMFFSGLAFIILGFLQFVFYPNLRNLYYLGWDEHLSRFFSTFLDPNFAGAFIVLYIIFVLALLGESSLKGKKFFLLSSLLMSLIALALTFSRSALIMFVVSIFVFLTFTKKVKLAVLLIGVVILSYVLIPTNFSLENTNLLRTASINARQEEIIKAGKIFIDHPIFGVGFNSYRYARENYGNMPQSLYQDHAGAGVPNIYMFLLATTGIAGLIFFLFLMSIIIKDSVSKIKSSTNFVHAAIATSIIGLLTQGLFENGFFYSFIMIWIFLLLGIAGSKKISSKTNNK